MAVVDLPDSPGPREFSPVPVDFGGVERSPTGGAAQRVLGRGNRWSMEFVMPPLEHNANGRTWAARLSRAVQLGARIEVPLTAGNQGNPGTSVVVDGAGQTGTTLNVRGLTAGWAGLEGYWLSIVKDGRHHLHMLAANVTASGGGTAALTLNEALRVPFADGAAVHLAAPKIEGFLVGDPRGWTVNVMRHVGLSFAIEEAV